MFCWISSSRGWRIARAMSGFSSASFSKRSAIRLGCLEQDKSALQEYYAEMTPDALESLTPEERHRVYGMLGLGATIKMDGTLELSGTFDEGASLCGLETRYSML